MWWLASPGPARPLRPLSLHFAGEPRQNKEQNKAVRLRRAKGKGEEEEDTWFLLLFCFGCVKDLSKKKWKPWDGHFDSSSFSLGSLLPPTQEVLSWKKKTTNPEQLQLGFFFVLILFIWSEIKGVFSCPCGESCWTDPEPVCSRILGQKLHEDILKRVFLHQTAAGSQPHAQRRLKPLRLVVWWELQGLTGSRFQRHRCTAVIWLQPEPRGQPELSPQEGVELQKLQKLHFKGRSALVHCRDSPLVPEKGFLAVYWGQEEGRERQRMKSSSQRWCWPGCRWHECPWELGSAVGTVWGGEELSSWT